MAEAHTHGEAHASAEVAGAHDEHQQHPLNVYFTIWGLLFVLSIFSYMVDYAGLQGFLRWSLILIFMVLKAGFIMAIFMHLKWERLALNFIILLPPIAILVFVAIMAAESDYTAGSRDTYFTPVEFTETGGH